MLDDAPPDQTPQFSTAEYAGMPGADHCRYCNQNIAGHYYRVNDSMTCPSCAELAGSKLPQDSHVAYMRALLFGAGGALAGLTLYATVAIVTGWMIGYVSLAVGYLVGKAMMAGSKGMGGRRYQITAILLTYAAVSMAAIPIGIAQMSKEKKTHSSELQAEQRQLEDEFGQEHQQPAQQPPEQTSEHPAPPAGSFAAAFGYLALMGLASPFLELQDPVHGFIGLIILSVGIQIAWKLTAGSGIKVEGPFDNSAST